VMLVVSLPARASAAGSTPSPEPSPVTVTPSWEGAPWQPKVQTLLNVTAQTAIVCCLFAVLAGAAVMGISRMTGSYQGGSRGLVWVIGGLGGALIVLFAAPALNWLLR
jgi:hypothetical protein